MPFATVASAATAAALATSPIPFTAMSSMHRVPVLELFTSEGCSSCPLADALLGKLASGEAALAQVIPLAYHVSYWDNIGWPDRFASRAHDARQADYQVAYGARSVYTPQFVLDGAEAGTGSGLERKLRLARAEAAPVSIALAGTWDPMGRRVTLHASVEETPAGSQGSARRIQQVIFERHLETVVKAGENGGRTLVHDFVVRAMAPPSAWRAGTASLTTPEWSLEVPAEWKTKDLGIAAFVQEASTMRIVHAVARMLPRQE